MDEELVEVIKEAAVVVAMNGGIYGVALRSEGQVIKEGKKALMEHVTVEDREQEVAVVLDYMKTVGIAPLYGVFTAAWQANTIQRATRELLWRAPELKGREINFYLR
jgi:hypothetical protein